MGSELAWHIQQLTELSDSHAISVGKVIGVIWLKIFHLSGLQRIETMSPLRWTPQYT